MAPDRQSKRPKGIRRPLKNRPSAPAQSANKPSAPGDQPVPPASSGKGKEKAAPSDEVVQSEPAAASKPRVRRLAPPRPFPTVPTSVSATGPRSAHREGKNYICISRKTELGAYLRRCKDVVLKDGYKTLHLSAMGAAIPHLLLLTTSLPDILPFSPDEIRTEYLTGTVEVQDELLPEDEDEDISYRTRGKSSLSAVVRIAGGDEETRVSTSGAAPAAKPRRFAPAAALASSSADGGAVGSSTVNTTGGAGPGNGFAKTGGAGAKRGGAGAKRGGGAAKVTRIVVDEPEQDEMDET